MQYVTNQLSWCIKSPPGEPFEKLKQALRDFSRESRKDLILSPCFVTGRKQIPKQREDQ